MVFQDINKHANQPGFISTQVVEKINILILACGIAALLLIIMQQLVSIDQPSLKKATTFKLPQIVYLPKETGVITENPADLRQIALAPVIQQKAVDDIDIQIESAVITPNFVPSTVNKIGEVSAGGSAIKLTPSTIIYPARAQQLGLCGWAMVQFNITEAGTVSNAVVVDSSNSMFNRASIKSVMKDRYKPQTEAGKSIGVVGKQVKIIYELESGC